MLQKTITEWWDTEPVRGIDAISGTVFKTICKHCNNQILGSRDQFISDVTRNFTDKLILYLSHANSVSDYIKVPFNSVEFSRAMLGHLMASSSVDECKQPLGDTPFFSALRKFVLGLTESLKILMIFTTGSTLIKHKSLLVMYCFATMDIIVYVVLYIFFPISFLVTFKGEGTFPAQAVKLELKHRNLHFNVSMRNADYVTFPFVPIKR